MSKISQEDVTSQTKARLATVIPQFPILLPSECCHRENFLNGLHTVVVEIISNTSLSEPNTYQSEYCSRRAESYLLQSFHTTNPGYLESAIALSSVAVTYLQKDYPKRGMVVSMLGRALNRRWEVTKEDKYLDDAIYYFQKTVEIEPEDEPKRAIHFDDLGCAIHQRYIMHHRDDDFQAGKLAFESAAELPDSGKPMFLSNLALLVKAKADVADSERATLLKESLGLHMQAVACITTGFPYSINDLYKKLAERYADLFDIDDVDPVGKLEDRVDGLVRGTGRRWLFLHELAAVLIQKFSLSGRLEDVDVSITLLRTGLDESPRNTNIMLTLAQNLESRGLRLYSMDHFREAYSLLDTVLNAMGDNDPKLLTTLFSASHVATLIFQKGGRLEDLDKAITLAERGLGSPLMADVRRWKFQRLLGKQLRIRFETTEQAQDLAISLSSLKGAVGNEDPDISDLDTAENLREYARCLILGYTLHKNKADYEEAIQCFKRSIELGGTEDINIVFCLNELGKAALLQFERTGCPDDAQLSIDYHLKALIALDHFPLAKAEKFTYFIGLGNAFYMKYEMWDQIGDLNQAIFYYEAAVVGSDASEPRVSSRTASLSRALIEKFRVTKDQKFFEAAQERLARAVSQGSPSLKEAAYLHNIIGASYLHAFESSKCDVALLDNAAACFQRSLDTGCTQPTFVNTAVVNLTTALMVKYEWTKSEEDFEKVCQQMETANNLNLFRNPNKRELRGLFATLGQFCSIVYYRKKRHSFGEMAVDFYLMVAKDDSAFSESRLRASLKAAHLTYDLKKDATSSRDILVRAIDLLPHAILLSPMRSNQIRASKRLFDLPGLILSFSIAAGDPFEDALRRFERSRSFLWSRLLDMKTDLSTLREKHEDLAIRFEQLRNSLNRTRPQVIVTESSVHNLMEEHDAALEYNKLVDLIRQKDGFDRFLLLDDVTQLREHAIQGPIVILNTTNYRGDAVLITPEAIDGIELPEFLFEKCQEEATRLQSALAMVASDLMLASSILRSVLKWLWEAAAKPVLDKLEFSGVKNTEGHLPRIWWIVNGWTTNVPIHAAGDHTRSMETGEPCTVMDRVVSSYTPTIRALDYARNCASSMRSTKLEPRKAVLVKMPTTPPYHSEDELLNVTKEVIAVEEIIQRELQVMVLDKPRRHDVLSLLEQASMAHFACHGVADVVDPSLSQLRLKDWQNHPLDVRVLLRNSFQKLEFVYLSACETATNKASDLQAESIHLSAAFQMSGVPYTVGTLWSIQDEFSVEVASLFYSDLLLASTGINFGRSAEALHDSVLKARNKGVEPVLWASFVHFGA